MIPKSQKAWCSNTHQSPRAKGTTCTHLEGSPVPRDGGRPTGCRQAGTHSPGLLPAWHTQQLCSLCLCSAGDSTASLESHSASAARTEITAFSNQQMCQQWKRCARPTQSPPKPIYNRAANCTSNPGRNKGNEQAEHVHVCNSASHGSLTANRALLSKKWRAKSRPVLEGSHDPQASMQRTVSTPSSAHLSFTFTRAFIQPPS